YAEHGEGSLSLAYYEAEAAWLAVNGRGAVAANLWITYQDTARERGALLDAVEAGLAALSLMDRSSASWDETFAATQSDIGRLRAPALYAAQLRAMGNA
ncbi:MAG: hypothetical protein AAF125_08255, partial [Chloroflexota bacterium]